MMRNIRLLDGLRIGMIVVLVVVIVGTQVGRRDSNTPIDEVSGAVTANIDMEPLEESTNRMFRKLYGLNASDYDGVVLYSPADYMDAEELLIVKLEEDDQADEVTQAIETRLETQKNSFEGYGVEQFALLEDAVLDVQANYILYVVSADAQEADQAFRGSL